MEKEIAIIIPAYNAKEYINNLFETIKYQTIIERCKIILINDGYKDDYNFLYQLYPQLDLIILKTSSPQSGPGIARNIGIQYAIESNISYIVFADADDEFYGSYALYFLINSVL